MMDWRMTPATRPTTMKVTAMMRPRMPVIEPVSMS